MLFSEPKIPQWYDLTQRYVARECFSALQRAENSSMLYFARLVLAYIGVSVLFSEPKIPQWRCGSCPTMWSVVSVLFSEPKIPQSMMPHPPPRRPPVSVLFSEPKIPQFVAKWSGRCQEHHVSVLFSEPKIPQCTSPFHTSVQRATFQCSSASRKFLNRARDTVSVFRNDRFSALQRAENSSMIDRD